MGLGKNIAERAFQAFSLASWFTGFTVSKIAAGVPGVCTAKSAIYAKEYVVNSPQWPKHYRPLRVGLISDLHTGCLSVGHEELQEVCRIANAMEADIFFNLGDDMNSPEFFEIPGLTLNGEMGDPRHTAWMLSTIKAKNPMIKIMGNHDYFHGQEHNVKDAFKHAGIQVLENQSMLVENNDNPFYVVGLGDEERSPPNLKKAFADVSDDIPNITLFHNPHTAYKVNTDSIPTPALTAAGHTHGGQVVIGGIPIIMPGGGVERKMAYGPQRIGDYFHTIVTSGVGTSALDVRFGRPPEIVLVTLRHGQKHECQAHDAVQYRYFE